MKRYEYYDNFAIDTETGEMLDLVETKVIVGSVTLSPAERQRRKNYGDSLKRKRERELFNEELGDFYMVMKDNEINKLTPETAGRLVYLCTFLNFKNEFMMNHNKHMKKNDLPDVLGISRMTAYRFYEEIKDIHVKENDKGLVLISTDIIRGYMNDKKGFFQKFYIDAIRRIYETTKNTSKKYLGYVYRILPYINIEWNLICNNPFETDLEEIDTLSIQEMCEILDFVDESNFHRLPKIYEKITFDVNGEEEYFVSCVRQGNDYRFFVNPHILYSGSDYKQVKVLGAFSKKRKKKAKNEVVNPE